MNIIQDKFVCCVVELPATKLALDMFVRDRSTTAREKDLFRSVKVLCYLSHALTLTVVERPHPQSVAEISRHSVLSGDRIQQCETSPESFSVTSSDPKL